MHDNYFRLIVIISFLFEPFSMLIQISVNPFPKKKKNPGYVLEPINMVLKFNVFWFGINIV